MEKFHGPILDREKLRDSTKTAGYFVVASIAMVLVMKVAVLFS